MSRVVPAAFVFRYAVDVPRLDESPPADALELALGEECLFPDLTDLCDPDRVPSFARLKVAWHESGIALSLVVAGKTRPPRCRRRTPEASDGLFVWIDTRNTQTIHRASRFCHALCFLPSGGGKSEDQPLALARPIARAREDAPPPPKGSLQAASRHTDDGYQLDAWITASALHGWDTDTMNAIGFYWMVHDSELGDQSLLAEAFPYAHDPSLWFTLRLVAPVDGSAGSRGKAKRPGSNVPGL
ncbi:MAG: hypothetical protein VB859_03580 [Planctomycetaceae bacterium]